MLQMPLQIQEYIDQKYNGIEFNEVRMILILCYFLYSFTFSSCSSHNIILHPFLFQQDKQKLEYFTRTYFQDIVQNSVPIMKRYIDDIFSLQHTKSTNCVQEGCTDSDHEEKIIRLVRQPGQISTDVQFCHPSVFMSIETDSLNK